MFVENPWMIKVVEDLKNNHDVEHLIPTVKTVFYSHGKVVAQERENEGLSKLLCQPTSKRSTHG